jgi:hypothetical protein
MNRDDGKKVPDVLLERLARDELPPARAAQLRARLALEGEAGAARLAALEASNRDILEVHPPAVVAAEVHRLAALAQQREAARAARPRGLRLPVLVMAAGALGALMLVAVRRDPGTLPGGESQPPEQIGIKGLRPQLAVHRKLGDRHQRLQGGALVRPGDQLQLSYVAGERRFGVVASVDARGTVTLHLPEAPGAASALAPRKETVLPHAFELDDSPGYERFVFVSGDRAFSTELVAEALRPGGPPLPADLSLVDLTLRKDTPANKDKP